MTRMEPGTVFVTKERVEISGFVFENLTYAEAEEQACAWAIGRLGGYTADQIRSMVEGVRKAAPAAEMPITEYAVMCWNDALDAILARLDLTNHPTKEE